jgi:hypothetical protein
MKKIVQKKYQKIKEQKMILDWKSGFDSTVGAHRQLLLGADSNTTNKFDLGYDADVWHEW